MESVRINLPHLQETLRALEKIKEGTASTLLVQLTPSDPSLELAVLLGRLFLLEKMELVVCTVSVKSPASWRRTSNTWRKVNVRQPGKEIKVGDPVRIVNLTGVEIQFTKSVTRKGEGAAKTTTVVSPRTKNALYVGSWDEPLRQHTVIADGSIPVPLVAEAHGHNAKSLPDPQPDVIIVVGREQFALLAFVCPQRLSADGDIRTFRGHKVTVDGSLNGRTLRWVITELVCAEFATIMLVGESQEIEVIPQPDLQLVEGETTLRLVHQA